ncbi:MAG TPA: aspartate aminotransferase family protein [Solirubrobacteraceae bacterium]|jgi:adenosylmethionine-8-amino-7-oxononanoate aminotransferase|nr:aspartate aminotransferase family protein [Solirubrobacteraceae bacterium]
MDADELQRAAIDHLWLHFSRMGDYAAGKELPVIVSGEGCTLTDSHGRTYLDALAGLFAVQIGYSHGEEIGRAALEQMRELPFYTNWGYAHPRAIELASRLAELAPPGLERVFFTSSGSEAVESAWKLARQYHTLRGERRWKAISRDVAYHGTSLGALSITGVAALREPFEPLVPSVARVSHTGRLHRPAGESEAEFTAWLLDELERTIVREGPQTIAMVIMEPVQNAGGAFVPPAGYWAGVRELCDRFGILLCADEVISGFGRMGAWFACERYGIRPDLITCAKGLSSGYAAIGALVASERVMEPFLGEGASFSHGLTFGGHPVQAAIALANLRIMERLGLVERVAANQDAFERALGQLRALPIVGDVRGTGYFWAIELVKDQDGRARFTRPESESLVRGILSGRLLDAGLICRADDRGDPVIQLSPPLIAGQEEFDRVVAVLGEVLTEAHERVREPAFTGR